MKKKYISSSIHIIKNYFTFSRGERRGFFLLSLIIILLLVALYVVDLFPKKNSLDTKDFEKEVDNFEKQLVALKKEEQDSFTELQHISVAEKNKFFYEGRKQIELFSFNPNKLPADQWEKLGLSKKQIRVIQNYESKGGKFYKKEDVKKMYCITSVQYERIEPYISIPEMKKDSFYVGYDTANRNSFIKKDETINIDMNIASAEDFQKLKGIGLSKSNSIIAYRNKLGGFISREQFLEIYGMDSLLFENIKNQLELKVWNIRKININTNDPSGLKHPYITGSMARLMMNYRNLHGDFKSIEEIKKLALVNEETYRKIAPYLDIK